ncbi:unnamed protein product [Rhizophagus irregularis]|nr:unnamed protein product [Rhizophagus irregularis]
MGGIMYQKKKQVNDKLASDTNAISPLKSSQPETYDQLLSKLSLPIRKMCLSRKAQEEESKESDEWLSSLQYLNANINDLIISKSFLDTASEFGGINDPAIKALRWKADKPSNFAIKGNSKHITDSLGWYTDVPVTLKDKEDKTVTVIGNFVRIDNGETEPMLFFGMSNIRKVQACQEFPRWFYVDFSADFDRQKLPDIGDERDTNGKEDLLGRLG